MKEGHGAHGSIFAAERGSIGPFAHSHAVKCLFVIGLTLHMVNFDNEVLSVMHCMITLTHAHNLSKFKLQKYT